MKTLTHEITLNTVYIGFVISAVLPAITALATHRLASSRYKALVLAVLSVAAGAGQQILAAHGTFIPSQLAAWSATTFLSSVAAHYGLLKPTGLTGSQGILARSLPGGLGAPDPSAQPAPGQGQTGMAR